MIRFMSGRYGTDELSRAFIVAILACFVASVFFRWNGFSFIAYALVIIMYYRILSRNITKRREENFKYLDLKYNLGRIFTKYKSRLEQRRYYRFFKCPSCRQTVRVPKGHGRICITCPKCRTEFIKKV